METGPLCLDQVVFNILGHKSSSEVRNELQLFAHLICDAINEKTPNLKLTPIITEGHFLSISING